MFNIIVSREQLDMLTNALLALHALPADADELLGQLLALPAEDADCRDACHDMTL